VLSSLTDCTQLLLPIFFLMLVCFFFLFSCMLANIGMWLHRCCILKKYISEVEMYKLFCVQVLSEINMPQLLVTYLLFYILWYDWHWFVLPVEGDLHCCMCCDLCYNDCNSMIPCFEEIQALFDIFIFVKIQKHYIGNILLDCL